MAASNVAVTTHLQAVDGVAYVCAEGPTGPTGHLTLADGVVHVEATPYARATRIALGDWKRHLDLEERGRPAQAA